MIFYTKMAIFGVALLIAIWLIHRFPNSLVSRAALAWHGPYPTQGEHLSKFLLRRAIYTLRWFSQALLAFCALWLAVSWYPNLADIPLFMAFWFTLSLLGGTLLLATALYAASAVKQHLFGPNPEFKTFSEPPEPNNQDSKT